jgi:septum formation protein
MNKEKIILASGSKRRSKILSECGIAHTIVVSNAREIMKPHHGAAYNARYNAIIKATAIAERYTAGYIIGADTLVGLGKRLLGKPTSKKEARQFLKDFSGKTLVVYTGLCVIDARRKKMVTDVAISKIHVKKIPTPFFNKLLISLAPYDKAGGFSIEGVGTFIFDTIEGSFYNILGLPMITLFELFQKLGVNLLSYCEHQR